MTDKIYISNLRVPCFIGVYPHEKSLEQELCIDLEIDSDLSAACKSDNIEDAIDYEKLEQEVIGVCREHSHNLIEKLAQKIADKCLQDRRILAVKLKVKKPNALKHSEFAAVEIIRKQR